MVWNCKQDRIASRSIYNKTHTGYSCKDSTERFTGCSQESCSILDCTKVVSNIPDTARKQKRVDISVKHSQEVQLKKASVDTGGIDINTLIDGSGIVLE